MKFSPVIFQSRLIHILFWLFIACIWFYLRYDDYATIREAVWVTVIKVADLALVMYFANLVLVPKILYKKKYFLFALSFVLAVGFSSVLKMWMMSFVQQNESLIQFSNIKEKVYNNFVTQFFLVLASIGLKSVVDYLKLQNQLVQVAKEKAEAELNFLKSQINPHFLFNSLNSVYFLISKENESARAALHKFSDMLRYQLYECNGQKLPVGKEINYLKDYVDLQRLRINENCVVQFNCDRDVKSFRIEPLLLIPFVENSFKHVSHFNNGRKNEVQINISRDDGSLNFSVYNTIEKKQKPKQENSSGIGLANVKKRLELLYPGKYSLHVNVKEGWYGVDLKLNIQN